MTKSIKPSSKILHFSFLDNNDHLLSSLCSHKQCKKRPHRNYCKILIPMVDFFQISHAHTKKSANGVVSWNNLFFFFLKIQFLPFWSSKRWFSFVIWKKLGIFCFILGHWQSFLMWNFVYHGSQLNRGTHKLLFLVEKCGEFALWESFVSSFFLMSLAGFQTGVLIA